MCIHRSSNYSSCKFSIEVVVSFLADERNGVYKSNLHRFLVVVVAKFLKTF